MTLTSGTTLVIVQYKLVLLSWKPHRLLNIIFFLTSYVSFHFSSPPFEAVRSADSVLFSVVLHLDPRISFPVQQITDPSRVAWLLICAYKIANLIIFTFEQTQNFKRFECKNSKLLGYRHCVCGQIKYSLQ